MSTMIMTMGDHHARAMKCPEAWNGELFHNAVMLCWWLYCYRKGVTPEGLVCVADRSFFRSAARTTIRRMREFQGAK